MARRWQDGGKTEAIRLLRSDVVSIPTPTPLAHCLSKLRQRKYLLEERSYKCVRTWEFARRRPPIGQQSSVAELSISAKKRASQVHLNLQGFAPMCVAIMDRIVFLAIATCFSLPKNPGFQNYSMPRTSSL